MPSKTRNSLGGWICPECGRLFDRVGRGHDCAPGLSIDEYFATGPAHERPVFDAVLAHLAGLGPVHSDVVSVGIFLKNPRQFAQLRPARAWVAMLFALDRLVEHPLITRKPMQSGSRYWHTARIAQPSALDEQLRAYLTEAYLLART